LQGFRLPDSLRALFVIKFALQKKIRQTYPAEEAKRIKDRLELHYTPKHGSWLNMAEIELRVINNQGLPARVGTLEEMRQRVRMWNEVQNGKGSTITWRFTTADARIFLLKCQ
jgi:hypothetical protein